MSHAEKDALIRLLFEAVVSLESRLKELEGRVEKTSRNSSRVLPCKNVRINDTDPMAQRRTGGSGNGSRANRVQRR
jgi:hypothetical protein